MKNTKYKIYTLGCKVNQYDSGGLANELEKKGMHKAAENADFVFVNTCSVTSSAIQKCKRMIVRARKENPRARLAVVGCWAQTHMDEVKKMKPDYVAGVGKFDKLLKSILVENDYSAKKVGNFYKIDRSRYFIKIQDGCEQFCSYCIIPYNRGKLDSRPQKEIINEIKEAIEAGYNEIVLSGIHLGLYGIINTGNNSERIGDLTGLLRSIVKLKGLGRVRLSSIEVREITDELIELMKDNKKICKHLHIPMQSGTDKILKLMNRPYDTKFFEDKIAKLRSAMPNISITTDVIVGFPRETKKDFDETYKFINKINFSKLHVFSFSAHRKTPAYNFPEKVEKNEIAKRSKMLRELGIKLENIYISKFKGKELEVIVENSRGEKNIGKSEYYFDVKFDEKDIASKNKNCKVKSLIKIKTYKRK